MKLRPRWYAMTLALTALSMAAPARSQTAGRVARESVTSLGAESIGQAGEAAVSADGRVVAFQSDASDLVPNDTNGDSDVFVRDRATGVLQRVSLRWNGAQANGDSQCPSLSADGRFIAFRSRATNMVPGATSPGSRWMVYVHDRQERTTVRISQALGGGVPNGDSACPAIAGDGQRIAFASYASNLVASDKNETSDVFLYDRATDGTSVVSVSGNGAAANGRSENAAISQDGRFVAFDSQAQNLVPTNSRGRLEPQPRLGASQVYVRDLVQQQTELVSVALTHSARDPRALSLQPSISADGRFVAFRSTASNLVAPAGGRSERIYVRDRTAGVTWLASPIDPRQRDCGREGQEFGCRSGSFSGAIGAPDISADGRFVTFASRSLLHLPANQSHGDQIYVFDNLSRRLRRLSVDPTGVPGDACSWKPALSGDGTVLAYASKSANLVLDDRAFAPQQPDVDVFAHQRSCDDSGRCQPLAVCPAEPRDCVPAQSSLLRLRKHPPGGVNDDELYWRWYGEASAGPFPDPAGTGTYQACVYAGSVALDIAAPEAPACRGTARPCWRTFGAGYKLVDPDGGLTDLTVSNGSRTRRIQVRGIGPLLDAPYLPVDGSRGIVVQLHETGTGQCWGAAFPASSITRNIAGVAKAGSRRDGWLVAEIR